MAVVQSLSTNAAPAASDDAAASLIPLPASMQTLVERYTERTLTTEERRTLAQATPNVRCEALRIFFELNDAAAAIEYVLHFTAPSPSSGKSSIARASARQRSVRSMTSQSAVTTAAPAAAKTQEASPSLPRASGRQGALRPLSTNAPHPSVTAVAAQKAAREGKRSTPSPTPQLDAAAAAAAAVAESPTAAATAAQESGESPAATPSKQRMLRPPSFSLCSGGNANSGSKARRRSAARRGESMGTLVTVSSMSDSDMEREEEEEAEAAAAGVATGTRHDTQYNIEDHYEVVEDDVEEEEGGDDMPPTVTLRSRETRSTPAVPSLALDAVLKPNRSVSRHSTTASPAAAAAAPAVVAAAPAVREVSPSVLPPPGAQRIERSIASTVNAAAPSVVVEAAAAAPAAGVKAEPRPRRTVAAKPRHLPPPPAVAAAGEGEQEQNKKKEIACPAGEPTPDTVVPVPTPTAAAVAQRPTTHHHVAFTDANAMAVLEAQRRNRAPPLGAREEVELAYTELSCRHSSASPSCAAPSVASAQPTAGPAKKVDWAALVASVRAPETAATATAAGAPSAQPHVGVDGLTSPRHNTRPRTAAATAGGPKAAAPVAAVAGTPRQLASATQRRTAQQQSESSGNSALRTPRQSHEEASARKRRSGGSGHTSLHSTTTPVRPSGSSGRKAPPSASSARREQQQPSSSRLKRLSTGAKTPTAAAAAPAATPERRVRIRSADPSPIKHSAAWDEAAGMYVTHPNQLRRQLSAVAAAAEAAAAPAMAPRPAGASALMAPDALHVCFGRTASTLAIANSNVNCNSGGSGVGGCPPRTPRGGDAAAFGRLCSAALHLSNGATAKEGEATKTPRDSAGQQCKKNKKTGVAAVATNRRAMPVVVATPRSHHAGGSSGRPVTDYARLRSAHGSSASDPSAVAPPPPPPSSSFQRLRSGFPVVHPHSVYHESGEVISFQRQASQYPSGPAYPSVETLRRIASGAPPPSHVDPASRGFGEAAAAAIQPAGYLYCPSTVRSPRTARRPQAEGGDRSPLPPPHDLRGEQEGWPQSPREAPYDRQASRFHAHASAAAIAAAPPPPAQCGVFERLTSNYYAVYSSAAALQAPAAAMASPRGRHVAAAAAGASAARRRHISAPAARRGGVAASRRHAYPAMREGWLSPDGKVAATRGSAGMEEEAAAVVCAPAPAENVFARSNTSRYLNLNK